MCPAAVRLHDMCTGHGCFPPRPNDQASPNVMINSPGNMGRGSHRLTDHWVTHCLVGSTEISLLSGRSVAIADLVDNFAGEFVYSCTEDGKIVPGRIVDAFISTYSRDLVKVGLDNGKSFVCSPDHLIMLLNGTYVEADLLLPGESLMPLYRRQTRDGYVEVWHGDISTWVVMPTIPNNRNPNLGRPDTYSTGLHAQNHAVVSVENIRLDKKVPLYDLTIENPEETHNFALSCGVFVHNCCVVCHDSVACTGSPNVFVNNLPKCRVGDAVCCGSAMAEGSPNVFVNDPR